VALYYNHVIPMFSDDFLLDPEVMSRACRYLLSVSKRGDVHVADPRVVEFLLQDDKHVTMYLDGNLKFEVKWMQHLLNNQSVFITNRRGNRGWGAAVLWQNNKKDKKDKKCMVRVYNPNLKTRKADFDFAKKLVHICQRISPSHAGIPWYMHIPHDNYDAANKGMSGVATLARFWQLCKNQGSSRYLTSDTVKAVQSYLQVRCRREM